jgi:hypothetical protein
MMFLPGGQRFCFCVLNNGDGGGIPSTVFPVSPGETGVSRAACVGAALRE